MRHQAQQHLLHHRARIVEVTVRLAAGSVHDVVALAFAGIQPLAFVAGRTRQGFWRLLVSIHFCFRD